MSMRGNKLTSSIVTVSPIISKCGWLRLMISIFVVSMKSDISYIWNVGQLVCTMYFRWQGVCWLREGHHLPTLTCARYLRLLHSEKKVNVKTFQNIYAFCIKNALYLHKSFDNYSHSSIVWCDAWIWYIYNQFCTSVIGGLLSVPALQGGITSFHGWRKALHVLSS